MKVGFIGLGNMGASMALNLAKGGIEVFGFDADSSIKLPELTMTLCIPSLLKEVDVVFTMLPSGLIVKDIINETISEFYTTIEKFGNLS